MAPRVHIVGAGLAGLAAAVKLAERGWRVELYEAAPQAGGRCRSYFDKRLGCLVDNGNHLLLSGNWAAADYRRLIGANDAFTELRPARLPFLDLASGERWWLRPGGAWIFSTKKRVPGTRACDYLAPRLAWAGATTTVAAAVPVRGQAWRRFWQPLTVAALNTQPDEASAALLRAVLCETLLKGEAACRPLIAREGLGPALVTPALAYLAARGTAPRLGWRLRRLERAGDDVRRLEFDGGTVEVANGDRVVLALPPWNLGELLPDLSLPFEPRPIVNAHLRLPGAVVGPEDVPLLGLIGGTAEWLFVRGDLVSLTVSAAEALLPMARGDLEARLWADTAKALGLPIAPMPPLRLLIEKRATFAATPAAARHRPRVDALGQRLLLAGDWTATGLPATVESAVRSGFTAASVLSER